MRKVFLMSILLSVLFGACHRTSQKNAATVADVTTMQKSELFMILPDDCPTPDGMAIAPNGDLILACPNFADLSKPACLMQITKEGKISKWMDVPVLPETGWAAPMGQKQRENTLFKIRWV